MSVFGASRGKSEVFSGFMSSYKRVILCKYGEVALKGANKPHFEELMMKDLRERAARIGSFNIYSAQSTVYIEPQGEDDDIDAMLDEASHTFGFSALTLAAVADKNIDAIKKVAADYIVPTLPAGASFRADAKRADKTFPMKSPEIAASVGEAILEASPSLRVDLHNPDKNITVEVRERGAYIHGDQIKGAGGMPRNSNGRGILLLSGGIDSPVAGYMMMRRGVGLEAVHFESFPYTSEAAREKVLALAKILTSWCGSLKVHIISVTHIQEELKAHAKEDYFTLLLRRFMMRLSLRVQRFAGSDCLITGESLGQVASQTMQALAVTDEIADVPVFRPLIGMDKEEIVALSRKIGAFETSILPYEDCCTVFTPQHPKTRPSLENVILQEKRIDVDALTDEAWSTHEIVTVE